MTVVLSFASTAVAVSSVVLHSSFSTFKAHGAVSDIANHGLLNIAMWGSHICIPDQLML